MPSRLNYRSYNVWRKYDAMERSLTSQISQRMLDLAGLKPGMRVLDVATGRGEPAIPAARRVGPEGRVVGVDISETMLRMARERAEAEGILNLDLRVTSAACLPSGRFDAALARWGLMYMPSPVAALEAIRDALIPGAVLVSALWAEPERVPFFTMPRDILARHVSLPETDFKVPGPFRYSRMKLIRRDFTAAKFSIEHVEEHDTPVVEAATSNALLEWVTTFVLGRLLKDLPPSITSAWKADFLNEADALRKNGNFRLSGITRIIVSRKMA